MFDHSTVSAEWFDRMCGMFSYYTRPLYIQFDASMRVSAIWGDPMYYGLGELRIGQAADENIEFLVGVQAGDELELPIMSTPSGKPASVYVQSTEDAVSVLMLDAESEHLRQQEIQQKSNEVQLLARRQQQLMGELKQTYHELELKRDEADRANIAQSEFMSSISHEFRTPLTSVLGYTEILEKSLQEEPAAVERLGAISRGARHLLSLIENLLDHGQLRQDEILLKSRTTALEPIIEDVDIIVRPLADQKNLKFAIEIDQPAFQPLFIDGLRYRQILINLLGNAVKFTNSGQIQLSISWSDDVLTTRVTDTGEGIPAENFKKIFGAFERVGDSTESGAGLGLSISARLAELMHGSLVLESSSPDTGSVFLLTINAPLSTEAAGSVVDISDSNVYSSRDDVNVTRPGRKLLLAEDDDDIAMLIVAVMEEQGYRVEHVVNGQQAVDRALSFKPDVLLLDMNMPVLDGMDAIKRLRDKGFTSPAIALSASASSSAQENAISAGCDDYLVKPIDVATLVQSVSRYAVGTDT